MKKFYIVFGNWEGVVNDEWREFDTYEEAEGFIDGYYNDPDEWFEIEEREVN